VFILKKIIILSLIVLLSFTLVSCNNNNSKTPNTNNSNKENTLTCKWSHEWNSKKNKDLSIEFNFNFDSNDELISVNENQAFYYSMAFDSFLESIPSNTVELKEKIEEIKYVKVDINVNKSSKDMFFNYIIDINAIKNDLYDEIIDTDTYEKGQHEYPYYHKFPIFTLSSNFLKEYIHYGKETLKVKLISDLNFDCK